LASTGALIEHLRHAFQVAQAAIQRRGLAERGRGFGLIHLAAVQNRQPEPRRGILRLPPGGLQVAVDGLLQLFVLLAGPAQIDVGVGLIVLRHPPHDVAKLPHRPGEIARHRQ